MDPFNPSNSHAVTQTKAHFRVVSSRWDLGTEWPCQGPSNFVVCEARSRWFEYHQLETNRRSGFLWSPDSKVLQFLSKQSAECQEVHYSRSLFHPSEGVMSGCHSVLQASRWVKSPTSHSHWQPVIQPSAGRTRAAAFQCLLVISSTLFAFTWSWRRNVSINSFTQRRWRASFSSLLQQKQL